MHGILPARRRGAVAAAGLLAILAGVAPAPAGAGDAPGPRPAFLEHVGTAFLQENLRDGEAGLPTSAEIIDFSPNLRTMVYTDPYTGRLGFLDTTDPANPLPAGSIDLPGDPTSVAVTRRFALVSIVTSVDPDGPGPLSELDAPTGQLLVIDLPTRSVVRTIELAGQPDAIAVAPSGRYAAVVIENQRDEDENDGLLPQPPPGSLQVLSITGPPPTWALRTVALTGLADVAPDDPEPEYVDINAADQAVVSLQENNHLAVVDLASATVTADFTAGSTAVADVDTVEEELGPQGNGIISLDGSLTARRREPDTVAWVDGDTFATANEGDYEDENGVEGGSRGFTLFNVDGTVEFESGSAFEHEIVRAGHYPEARSENKGNEPEGLEVGTYRGRTLLFVASERANVVGVYEIVGGQPVFTQLLPTGIGPEGLKFRLGVLAVSAETDGLEDGDLARPFITFFEFERRPQPSYPYLVSDDDAAGLPIPWVAMSGLAGDSAAAETVWAVSDSFLAQAYLYELDVSSSPARIVDRVPVGGVDVVDQRTGDYDLEGVAARREGGFWLASEGRTNTGSSRPNLLVRTDASGSVQSAVPLPAGLASQATSSGFEGVAVTGTAAAGNEVVYVAIQREWRDDPAGLVKIGRYEVATDSWTFAHYPLDAVTSPAGGFVGLSELTALPDGRLAVVERDNQLGLDARIKRVYAIDPTSVAFAPHGTPLAVLEKTLLDDLLPELDAASISVPDKLEGLAVAADGEVFVVTDNDGVDANYGETIFLDLGPLDDAFAGSPPG